MTDDRINSPQHYKGHCLEAIEVIDDFELNFCLGNVVKYVLRAGKKGDALDDLKKAHWYIERELENRKSRIWDE